jgi:short-subunit dehydrogenase
MSDPHRPFALVTGASTGIGLELARVLAAEGHDLVVVAEEPRIHEVAAELGEGAQAFVTDLATRQGNEDLVAWLDALRRPIDVAALNAGIGVGGPFVETSLDADLRLVGLNVASTVHLAKAVARSMASRRHGRILFTSSIASQMPGPYNATYAASKSFVQSLSEALRVELADYGVGVTALLPGPTDTEFFRRAGLQGTRIDDSTKDDPAMVARAGYEALMAGKHEVVTGTRNKVQRHAVKLAPDPLKARLHGHLNARKR